MPLIVDGNNLLCTTMPEPLAGLDEARLCALLARSAWRGQRMVVVCDGGPRGYAFDESPPPGVELLFAGRGQSADDVILELIAQDSAPRRLTVVSTDREIRAAARRRRAKAVTSAEFVPALLKALATPQAASKSHAKPDPGPLPPEEVRRWLETFEVEPGEKSERDTLPWGYDFEK